VAAAQAPGKSGSFALFLFLIVLRRVLMGWPPPPKLSLSHRSGQGQGQGRTGVPRILRWVWVVRSRAKDGRGGTSLCLGPFGTVTRREGVGRRTKEGLAELHHTIP